jgi:hypothetical protein
MAASKKKRTKKPKSLFSPRTLGILTGDFVATQAARREIGDAYLQASFHVHAKAGKEMSFFVSPGGKRYWFKTDRYSPTHYVTTAMMQGED